jgi:hypothetical protein
MMRKILILFVLLSTIFVNAQEDKTVTLTVSGIGKTLEEAKNNALRSAIEQAFGAFISSKTEILNDNLVKDEIVSVANGNIQSFVLLNESQLPNGTYAISIKTVVSIDKLINFVEAKGVKVEIKGGLFALNIKQQLLNEQSETKAITDLLAVLHEVMQTSFNYSIRSDVPKSLDTESKNFEIPLVVSATCNKNIDNCADFLNKTLAALSLSKNEIDDYKSIDKDIFEIDFNYFGKKNIYVLRNKKSIQLLEFFLDNWEFYTSLFTVQENKNYSHRYENVEIYNLTERSENNNAINILWPNENNIVATFKWNDKKSLKEIENLSEYIVKPRENKIKIKNGGLLLNKDIHIVLAPIKFKNLNWNDANRACEDLIINGFNDWRMPTIEELKLIYSHLIDNNLICLLSKAIENSRFKGYWSNKKADSNGAWFLDLRHLNNSPDISKWYLLSEFNVIAIRTF